MALGMEMGLRPGHIVLDWDSAPLPQKGGGAPQFSAHVYCGQTALWIKMPLGTEVSLGPDDIVLDGDPAHPPKRAQPTTIIIIIIIIIMTYFLTYFRPPVFT